MPQKVEIEIGDDGRLGTLPEPVQAFVDRLVNESYGKAYAKARAEGRPTNPADVERLKALEEENASYKLADAERAKAWDEARKVLEQQHGKKLQEVSSALDSERTRARTLAERSLREQVRATALQHGANPDSVSDFLAAIVNGQITYDPAQDYAPMVTVDGQPAALDVEGLVKTELDKRPWFRKAPPAGGGSRGGASGMGATADVGKTAAYQAALAAFQQNANGETLRALQEAKRALES